MSTAKNVEIIPVGDPRRPDWIPTKNAQGWPLNVYIDEGCWREERWGQYVLPAWDPTKPGGHTGRGQTWQRATTFIGMAEYHGDGLTDYRIRHALAGLIRRPDLLVRATRLWELPDKHFMEKDQQDALKEEWREIAAAAHEASGGDEASRNGTEVHAAIEHVNRGGSVDTLPTSIMIDGVEADLTVWRRHVEAYLDLRDGDNGFEVFPELVERVVNPDEDGTSGKFDLLALYQAPDALIDNMNVQRVADGLEPLEYWTAPRFVVIDIKSGDIQYREKFSRQLYRYARADAYWIFEEDAYEDAPEDVCQDFGFVISVPWWEADPKVEMIPIPYGKVAINGTHACRQVKNARSLRLPTMKPVGLGYAPREEKAPEVPWSHEPNKSGFKARNKFGKVVTVEPMDVTGHSTGAELKAREDAERAAATVAQVAAKSNPNTDGDEAERQRQEFNSRNVGANQVTGPELAPLAGKGERGCGVCGRKGHRRGSPKCLGDQDPRARQAVEDPNHPAFSPRTVERMLPEGVQAHPDGGTIEHADGVHPRHGGMPTPDRFAQQFDTDQNEIDNGDKPQWCRRQGACAGAGWTGPVQEGDAWVCGDCGLPSRAGQISGTGRPADPMATADPDASVLDGHANDHPVKGELHVGPAAITGTDRFTDDPDPDDESIFGEMSDEEYWLQLLVAAQSRTNVIRVGQEAQKALGALTPALKEAGKAGLIKYPKNA